MIESGITFGEYHSFYDLNLILSREERPPARPKTKYYDVRGMDGSVDSTEVHGETKFADVECKFTFTMHPLDSATWEEKKTEISNLLNGKSFKITLDKDDEYYHTGRCRIDEYMSDKRLRQFVVVARVHPYKFKQSVTTVRIALSSAPKTINLVNDRKTVSPKIVCTNDNTVLTVGNATYNLSAGTHNILDIQLKQGSNPVTVSGAGEISFTYQEGALF